MDNSFNGKVAVIGLGYTGLPTAAALATRGIEVVGVDIDANRVRSVAEGEVPFVEPDLAVAVSGAVAMSRLTATTYVPDVDCYVIAVPTPAKADHSADISAVKAAVEAIAPQLRGGDLIILESTSPPGTTRAISKWLEEMRPDLKLPHTQGEHDVCIAHCPERVRPGRVMIEIVTNDRVIGGTTRHCAEKAATLYRTFTQGRIVLSDAPTAEMAKLAENAFRDVNLAFANELSMICDRIRVDVWEVVDIANRHPRVDILAPGPGVGGHCIAVDPWFIVSTVPDVAQLIRAAREVNDRKPVHVAEQVIAKAQRFNAPKVAFLGLAFKANIDDLRESPAIEIVRLIAEALPTVELLVVEPFVSLLPQKLHGFQNVTLAKVEEAIEVSDIIAVLVDHDHFRSVNKSLLRGKIVFDTRGLWR